MDTFAKRLLTVIGALLLIVYVGYQVFLVAYSPVKLETAISYSEYETVDTDGLIIRSETMVPMNKDGFVYYVAENGSRVSKGGRIADIYANEQDAVAQKNQQKLDQMIEELENIQEQGQNGRTNLNVINTQLRKLQTELIAEVSSPSFSDIDGLFSDLLSVMNKQQITIGRVSDFSERIAQLKAQRDQLSAAGALASVTSPVAGYFVNSIDGYENTVSVDSVLSMTTTDINNVMQEEAAPETGYIGKVVGSYEWYLACVVPSQKMAQLALDSTVKVRLPFVSGDPIPVTIVAENRDRDGNVAVILRCDYMSAELSDIRKEQVQILVKEHSGLRVPDEAVHFNENGEAGVYVQEGNMISFRRIQVLYHSETENYSICAAVDDDGYLKLYDDIVTEGKNLYDGKIVHG
ncbi:MAG: HlyD family efflux transporter periplasmic adaptor subunit [Acutalibacteraceae bacterium]